MFELPIEIKEILDKIEEHNFTAYLVGGAVRDFLLGKIPSDYDISTSAKPNEIEEIFKNYIENLLGKEFGTITIRYKSYRVEITSYRIEKPYIKNRKPSRVIFTEDLHEDLARRDFTINAMALSSRGDIIDIFSSREDLKNKLIRSVGDPRLRIREDALRILRAIRFSGQLNFKIEENLYKEIEKNRDLLNNISKERIASEFNKILLSDKPSISLNLMKDSGLLEVLFPSLYNTVGYDQKSSYHEYSLFDHILKTVDGTRPELSLRLAGLFHDVGKPLTLSFDENNQAHYYNHDKVSASIAEKVLKEYNYSNSLIEKVKLLILDHMKVSENLNDKGLKRQIKRVGKENIFDLYNLLIADRLATSKNRDVDFLKDRITRIENLLSEDDGFTKKDYLKVNGKDIIKLGFKEGKLIGDILVYLNDLVIDNPSLNEKGKLLKIIEDKYR